MAFNKIFNLQELFGLSYGYALSVTVIVIGVIGSIYAIFGGLKAVAVSDTINAILILIGGLLVTFFGIKVLGDGSFISGI